MRQTLFFSVAASFSTVIASPLRPTLPRLPRHEDSSKNILDILPSEVTDPLSEVVDTLPVDVEVSALSPEKKRDAAISVDLGGSGASLKRDAALDVDLGGAGINVKRDASLDVDLGGAGLNIKRGKAPSNNVLDILPGEITDPLSDVVDKLPIDVEVSALSPEKKRDAAVSVDLGGAGVSL